MTSFHIITAGCTHNRSDSEQMAGLLKKVQFTPVDTIEEADIIIFNTCTVKSPTETKFFSQLEDVKSEHPYKTIIVTGCIPQTDAKNPKLKDFCLLGTRQIHRIVEVVEEAINDNVVRLLEKGEMPPLNLPRVRKNPTVGIIPISVGCLGACSFCKTKSARFNLQSYPIIEIKAEASKAINSGVKEIWLTSQDTFCYGFDIKTNIVELLKELVKIPADFKIRVGMGNPDHLPTLIDGLIEIYKHPKIFKFLHLPLQAGHNDTLKAMNRNYTVQKFRDYVDQFKKAIPELNLMTDIIVGFPDETEEHFWGTMQAIRRLNPDSINISRFWPRKGTKAAKMNLLQGDVVKHRSKVITDIFQNISRLQNERWVGWQGEIIIDEKGKHENQWIGRNSSYKQVIVEGDYKFGDVVKVKIVKGNMFDLRGERV